MSMKYILGTSSVQWSDVVRLESKQLFLVKTEDGSVYTGTLNTTDTPSGRPMEIDVAERSGKEVLNSARIVEMDTTSSKFLHRFNGNINTGTIYSKGNQSTQYSLGSQVNYPRERWAAEASFNSTLSSSTGATASTRNRDLLRKTCGCRQHSESSSESGSLFGLFLSCAEEGGPRPMRPSDLAGYWREALVLLA